MTQRVRYTANDVSNNRFFQMPKFLFESEFKTLSNNAKVLYSLLRDRHDLSLSNNWINENNEVYLNYTRKNMQEMLGLADKTVKKAVEQLKDFGLIEEEHMGLNKANRIYLTSVNLENKGLVKSTTPEQEILRVQTRNNYESRNVEVTSQETYNLRPNDTDFNNTDFSDTESINLSGDGIDGIINNITSLNSKKKKSPSTHAQEKTINTDVEKNNSTTHNITNSYELHKMVKDDLYNYKGIPYHYKANNQLMTEAVHILTSWGSVYDWEQYSKDYEFDCELYKLTNQCLIDMMCSDEPMKLNNSNVTYKHVIDAVNESIKFTGKVPDISDFIFEVKSDYGQAHKEKEIKNPKAYMKSCIWTSLNTFKLKFANKSYQMLKNIGAVE